MKSKSLQLLHSILALLLCVSMLAGTTFAWFTDEVRSGINTIAAGNLDVELYHSNAVVTEEKVTSATNLFLDVNGEEILWEPGVVAWENLRIANAGDLALVYQLAMATANENHILDPNGGSYGLSRILKVGVVEGGITATDRAGVVASVDVTNWTTLTSFVREGSLLPEGAGTSEKTWGIVIWWEPGEHDNYWNLNNGKVLDQGTELQIDLGVKLVATQTGHESDAFGSDYDAAAKEGYFPEFVGGTASVSVTPNAENKTDSEVSMASGKVAATVPAGAQLLAGTTALTLSVTEMGATGSNVVLGEHEQIRSLNVHVEGIAPENTAPITVTLTEVAPVGLNMGNYQLYHVENGVTNEMTLVASGDAFTAHNQFKYDPATGTLVLYMASFSEVAVVAGESAWEGSLDYSWYDADAATLTIANADQLAAFGAIVGGMKVVTGKNDDGSYVYSEEVLQDSFSGQTVKLLSNINLGDAEQDNVSGKIFYPIGYWNSEGTYEKSNTAISSGFYAFEGIFDGNGNTVSDFYQNTWEMKGDHDWYDANLQYFRDGMGLFGKVYGGTVKNLTVDNFSCDSEIGTSGVIAAYADSKDGTPAVFENITIANCNPRVYNIGNGGIVGCAGWYSRNESLGNADYTNAVTFRNITVDQTNKISALWGSWGVSCAGILGQYYPNSNCGIKLENCHVAAIIDVNNDVCSNYQYYWYRYAGMFIGTIRANTKDSNGDTVADTTGVSATGCTYTMGNWNEYWYCEIVANSLASYTHDHQFSRLDNIYDLSEISDDNGQTWKQEGHFALLDGNRNIVDCYHIFKNSDSELYRHFHDQADESNPEVYETVNGETILKEDRQRYFIPFNQLLTGLDMGIRAHTEFDGIQLVENGTTKSEQKFNATANNLIPENGTVTIGSLFEASGAGEIVSPTVQVYVSPVGVGSNVSATYTANTADWDLGTLTFSGTGAAKVVINDYYYCTSTTLPVYVLGGEFYIGATRSNGTHWYMTNDLGTANTTRFQATSVSSFPSVVTDMQANQTFTIIPQGGNTYKLKNTLGYIGQGTDAACTLTDETGAAEVTVTYHAEKHTFVLTLGDTGRMLALNDTAGYDYFAWYKGEITNLVLIPVETCPHSNTTTTSQAATCTEDGVEGYITCDDCLAILNEGTILPATGHNYVDGVCSCGEKEPAAGKVTSIAVGDVVILVCDTKNAEFNGIDTTGTVHGAYVTYTDAPSGAMPLTVVSGASTGTYAFKLADDQYLSWSSGNSLTTATEINENASWTVTFDTDGNAIIKNAKDASRMLRWNASSPRFACYTSAQTAVQLYKASNNSESGDEGSNTPDGTWVLVTDVTQLMAEKQIVIVAAGSDYALSTTQNGNNRGSAAVTKSGDTVTFGDDVQILTLEAGITSGTFAFQTGSGYLYAASSSSNHLRTKADKDANGSWAISIASSGVATVKAQGSNTHNWLRFNKNNNPVIFSAYASGQNDIQIYMLVE